MIEQQFACQNPLCQTSICRNRQNRSLCLSFNLTLNLVSYIIERQRREIIVVYPDIKLCMEEVLKASSVNPGV